MIFSKPKLIFYGAFLFLVLSLRGWATEGVEAVTPGVAGAELQQQASLHGRIHQLGSPDPVAGAFFQVLGLTQTATSDQKGIYELELPAGTWSLRVTADGYAPLSRTVKLKPDERRGLDLGLNPTTLQSDVYEVTAHRERPQAIQVSVTRQQIKEIPGTFGDALRAVEVLPGVGVPSDISGQLLVQGGGTADNLYLIDAMPWPIPYHFGGILSTVSPDLLNSVDLYEAGYNARWGGALAGVLDAKTLAPDSDRLHGDLDLSLLWAEGSVEGPLGLGDATFAITGRRSYLDFVGRLLKYNDLPVFWDGQGVLNFSLGRHNQFHVLTMASDDNLDVDISSTSSTDQFDADIVYNQDFQTGGVSWVNTSLADFTSTFTPYVTHTDNIESFNISSDGKSYTIADNIYKTTYGVKEEGVWSIGKWMGVGQELGLGGDLELSDYTFYGDFPRVTYTAEAGGFSSVSSTIQSLPAPTNSSVGIQGLNSYAYLQDRLELSKAWALTLGMHYDTSSLVTEGGLGPRVSLEWKVSPADKVTAAWGLYDQAPVALDVNPQFGNPGLQLESAEHMALAYEHTFSPSITGKVDGYYKYLSDLIVMDPSNANIYDNRGIGYVKGLDLSLKEDLGMGFFGWVSYSYSDSERLNLPSESWAPFQYDQTNTLNLVGSYSPTTKWTFGAKLRYNTGNPDAVSGTDYYSYDSRAPNYLRLDLKVERTWRFQSWTLKAYLDVINALDRKNVAEQVTNSSTGQTDDIPDLPWIPNIGVEAKY